jgi:hypothetical protein
VGFSNGRIEAKNGAAPSMTIAHIVRPRSDDLRLSGPSNVTYDDVTRRADGAHLTSIFRGVS